MKALDIKLLRDLRRLWSQALTIALVVASGVGSYVTALSAVDSLAEAREAFYAQGRFADVFAALRRAPRAMAETLAATPGVGDLQLTIERVVRVDIAGVNDPLLARMIGIDARQPRRLNAVMVRSGAPLDPESQGVRGDGAIDALVSASFAQSHGLEPGSRLSALINGRQRALVVRGIALSPEYVFAGMSGMPDLRGFGVLWVDERVLAAAWDMEGAFDHVAVKLAPGANPQAVIAALNRQLAPYGGRDAHAREHQTSHAFLQREIDEQRVFATVLPVIFLGVAAFLLNVVISRLVATQREQIAALKALGYPDRAIAAHFMKLVAVIVSVGLVIGFAGGEAFGRLMTGLYAGFFQFPAFAHRMTPSLFVTGALVAVVTALAGTLNAIWATVRLPPAEAMRPPAPGRYRGSWIDRIPPRVLGPGQRMILRNMQRRPWRTTLAILGMAAAVAIVMMGNFARDSIAVIVDTAFSVAMRADLTVRLVEPGDAAAQQALARLPGVIAVESGRDVAVRFVAGHRTERGAIQGLDARPELRRVVDLDRHAATLPGEGLLMTDRLAAKLGLRVGDWVQVDIIEGRQQTLRVPVTATVREMMGLNAYMERRALNRLLGESDVATAFSLALERGAEPATLAAIRQQPRLVGTFSKASLERNMNEISARNIRIMSSIMTVFAVVIAVGVVYNNARIALAERTWELASLRVLGFTRGEVSALLLGEQALLIALALPLGMLMGEGLVRGIVSLLASDQFAFPVALQPRTYAWAALCVVAAGLGSALVVRRRVDRLDLVGALKTRE
ncbi:MAG: ABC transporter permease [Burkholderiales bacterium]